MSKLQKIVNKAKHWHRHGKHRPIIDWIWGQERNKPTHTKPKMHDDIRKLFQEDSNA